MHLPLRRTSWFSSVTDPEEIANRNFLPELLFTTSRSSGPGGQHVNKLETRVSLRFHVLSSQLLSEEEKTHLLNKWQTQLSNEGFFSVHAEKFRSQLQNKEEAIAKFRTAIKTAFIIPKKRKATKPTKASVQRRITNKKKHSDKKSMRKPPRLD